MRGMLRLDPMPPKGYLYLHYIAIEKGIAPHSTLQSLL